MTNVKVLAMILIKLFICLPPSSSLPPHINMNKISEILNPSQEETSINTVYDPLEEDKTFVLPENILKTFPAQFIKPQLLMFDKNDFLWVDQLIGEWGQEYKTFSGVVKEDINDRPDDAGRIVNTVGQRRNPGNPSMSTSIKTSIPLNVYQQPHYHNDYDYYDYYSR